MLTAVAHGTLLAFGLILPLGPQNAFVISQGARRPGLARALFLGLALAGRLMGHVPAVRRVLGRASAAIMWATALYLALPPW